MAIRLEPSRADQDDAAVELEPFRELPDGQSEDHGSGPLAVEQHGVRNGWIPSRPVRSFLSRGRGRAPAIGTRPQVLGQHGSHPAGTDTPQSCGTGCAAHSGSPGRHGYR